MVLAKDFKKYNAISERIVTHKLKIYLYVTKQYFPMYNINIISPETQTIFSKGIKVSWFCQRYKWVDMYVQYILYLSSISMSVECML